jgi:hypothetical protein
LLEKGKSPLRSSFEASVDGIRGSERRFTFLKQEIKSKAEVSKAVAGGTKEEDR